MKIGLIGLPKSGKTTLFNLLTGSRVATSRFDAGKAELHAGIARVPDDRVTRLAELFTPRRTTYATFEVVDLAGIARGERAGLETKEFRDADALLHVVRGFADAAGAPADPRRDIEDLETELLLADLEVIERRLERLEANIKKRRTETDAREQEILRGLRQRLEGETPIRGVPLPDEDAKAIRGFTFLSQKPILHCLNLDEKDLGKGATLAASFGLQAVAERPRTALGWVSAVIEGELGLSEPAIHRVLRDCFALLGLISFFTTGDDEVRAWPIPRGTRAQDAASTIHSDIARGFIRAEVASYADLVAVKGNFAELRAKGQLRLEGKDYVVQDGEICHFRFNVAK